MYCTLAPVLVSKKRCCIGLLMFRYFRRWVLQGLSKNWRVDAFSIFLVLITRYLPTSASAQDLWAFRRKPQDASNVPAKGDLQFIGARSVKLDLVIGISRAQFRCLSPSWGGKGLPVYRKAFRFWQNDWAGLAGALKNAR